MPKRPMKTGLNGLLTTNLRKIKERGMIVWQAKAEHKPTYDPMQTSEMLVREHRARQSMRRWKDNAYVLLAELAFSAALVGAWLWTTYR